MTLINECLDEFASIDVAYISERLEHSRVVGIWGMIITNCVLVFFTIVIFLVVVKFFTEIVS